MKWTGITQTIRRMKEEINECQSGISTDGRCRVILSGCRELLTYTENTVRMRCEQGILSVTGTGLSLRAFHGNRMLVEGKWTSVSWEDEE